MAQAPNYLNKDICIAAHIYEIVQLPDGTRFMDVCPPETTDAECRFTIVSLRRDRGDVGELNQYRATDVNIRGMVDPMHGRTEMALSHVRRFYGGPPKFKPNPRLLHGFQGDAERPAVNDPELRPRGGHRAFMNPRDQEPHSTKQVTSGPLPRPRQSQTRFGRAGIRNSVERDLVEIDRSSRGFQRSPAWALPQQQDDDSAASSC